MITRRPAGERGAADFGWLDSRHSFSFGDYYDPDHMGFGSLRVINEDRVQPGAGFDTHGHQDMEIVSYVLEGALAHADSLGTGSVIRPGNVQRMTAGAGIRHSEFNQSKSEAVHFLQIWILPERKGLAPGYEQKSFPERNRRGRLLLVGSRDGRDGSVTIHQDVDLYAGLLDAAQCVTYRPGQGHKIWVQVARGALKLNGRDLAAGDGAAAEDVATLTLTATDDTEVLVFDMA